MEKQKYTIKDIARFAGVSPSTVSRVLDDNPKISEETKETVREVIKKYGFKPLAAARNLARKTTNAIGIVIPHDDVSIYSSSFFHEALKGICSRLADYGYDVLISSGNPTELDAISRLISTSKVDGIILLRSVKDDPNIRHLRSEAFPFVLIGTCLEFDDVCCVDNNNVAAGYDLTEHILSTGKKRIALVGGSDSSVFIIRRLEGYKKCLKSHGIPIDESIIRLGQNTEAYGYDSMTELLNAAAPPDAVIIMDDLAYIGVNRAIVRKQLRIPRDIAVACINESGDTKYAKPALTTVSLDFNALGSCAADKLIGLLRGKQPDEACTYVKHQLALHGSTLEVCGNSN
jgi:Transcriptional regulators